MSPLSARLTIPAALIWSRRPEALWGCGPEPRWLKSDGEREKASTTQDHRPFQKFTRPSPSKLKDHLSLILVNNQLVDSKHLQLIARIHPGRYNDLTLGQER